MVIIDLLNPEEEKAPPTQEEPNKDKEVTQQPLYVQVISITGELVNVQI